MTTELLVVSQCRPILFLGLCFCTSKPTAAGLASVLVQFSPSTGSSLLRTAAEAFEKSPVNSASTTNSSTTTKTNSRSQRTTSSSTLNTTTLVMTVQQIPVRPRKRILAHN